jgi:phosphatidylglycerophosphate synthase
MRAADISLSDRISLARVALAFIFLVCFRSVPSPLLTTSILAAVLAQISDHLDGYVVRKLSTASVRGWLFDSFSDRAFYIAALLAFEREFQLNEALVWAFVLREVALYAIRVAVGDFESLLPGFRKLALIHAAITRIGIVVGCLMPFHLLLAGMQTLTVIIFCATILGFLNLYLLIRKLP